MKQLKQVIFPLLALIVFCFACKRSQSNDTSPDNLLSEQKFQEVFVDVLLADAYVQELPIPTDSQKMTLNKAYAQIFDHHHVSREAYFNTLSYYNMHPDKFTPLLDPVKDTLSELEAESGR